MSRTTGKFPITFESQSAGAEINALRNSGLIYLSTVSHEKLEKGDSANGARITFVDTELLRFLGVICGLTKRSDFHELDAHRHQYLTAVAIEVLNAVGLAIDDEPSLKIAIDKVDAGESFVITEKWIDRVGQLNDYAREKLQFVMDHEVNPESIQGEGSNCTQFYRDNQGELWGASVHVFLPWLMFRMV